MCMSGYVNLADKELLELTIYAIHAEPSEERTKKVARLGRCLLWPNVAMSHGEDYANALPDEFWEMAYDRYAERMDEAILHGTTGRAPIGILGDDMMWKNDERRD